MPSSVRPRGGSGTNNGSRTASLPVTPMSERQQLALLMQMTSGSQSLASGTSSPTTCQQHKARDRNERGETPLHLAAIRGDVDQVSKLLAQRGADANAVDFAGWTPLHEACNHGWLAVATKLIQAGAVVNARGLDDDSPLHDASSNGHLQLVRLLVERGADVNAKNRKGRTPYDVATVAVAAYIRENTSSPGTTAQLSESSAGQRAQPRLRDDKKASGDSGGGGKKADADQQQSAPKSDDVYEFKPKDGSAVGGSTTDAKCPTGLLPAAPAAASGGTESLVLHPGAGADATTDALPSAGSSGASPSVITTTCSSGTNSVAAAGGGGGATLDDGTGCLAGGKRTYGEATGTGGDAPDDTGDEETRRKKRKDSDSVKEAKTSSGQPATGASTRSLGQTGKTNCKPGAAPGKTGAGVGAAKGGAPGPVGSGPGASTSADRRASPCSSPKPVAGTVCGVAAPASTAPASAGGGAPVPGGEGAPGDPEDTRADLKVPPLKIVIPQGGGEPGDTGGARNGKSSSQRAHHHHHHHQALPYVVSSGGSNSNDGAAGQTPPHGTAAAGCTAGTGAGGALDKDSAGSGGNSNSSTGSSGGGGAAEVSGSAGSGQNSNGTPAPSGNAKAAEETAKKDSFAGTDDQVKSATGAHHQRVLRSSHRSGGGATSNTGPGASGGAIDRNSNNSSPLLQQQQQQQRSPSPSASPAGSTENSSAAVGTNQATGGNNGTANGSGSGSPANAASTGTASSNTSEPHKPCTNTSSGSAGDSDSSSTTGPSAPAQPQQAGATASTAGNATATTAPAGNNVELHPRKRKMRPNKETPAGQASGGNTGTGSQPQQQQQQQQHGPDASGSVGSTSAPGTGDAGPGAGTGAATVGTAAANSTGAVSEVHPHEQPITNCYQLYLNIRKQIERRRKSLFPVQPKPPQGFKDYLMNRCTYVLAGTAPTVPNVTPPPTVPAPMRELYGDQEKERYRLRMQHVIEKEKLVLSVEQEILRVHGRAARALANQSLPFSVCTVLRDEEVYNIITPEQEEKDRNARSRYNGRLFLSWLQDVDDKWEKIKEHMLLRHHNEAESLHAVQKMAWEWTLKEQSLCEYKATPHIDEIHVPMVHVSDDFDLLPA